MAERGRRAPAWRQRQDAVLAAYRDKRGPRPKRLRCVACGTPFKVEPRGALRLHCCQGCRQRRYLGRAVAKGAVRLAMSGRALTPLQALRNDHDRLELRTLIQGELRALLGKALPKLREVIEQHEKVETELRRRERAKRARESIRLVNSVEPEGGAVT